MSYVLEHVAHDNIQNWIGTNAPGSVSKTVGDSWRNYLAANSGTGGTLYDQETAFLRNLGFTTGTLGDRWNAYLAAQPGKNVHEKLRNKYR